MAFIALYASCRYTVKMRTGQLATRIGVSTSTIRLWCSEYRHYLSTGAVGSPDRQTRDLDDHDCLVLATVADMRGQGLTRAQIVEALDAGKLLTALPEAPTPAENEARQSISLVPMPEYQRLADLVRVKESEIDRVQEQYNQALISLQEANDKIAALREEIGMLRGQVGERLPVRTTLQIAAVITIGMLVLVLIAVVLLAGRGGA